MAARAVPLPAAPEGPGARRQVLLGTVWTATGQLLPALGTAVLSVTAARVLGGEALGRQSVIAYVNTALVSILFGALDNASVRELAALAGADERVAEALLARWVVRAHVALGPLVLAVLCAGGGVVGTDLAAWVLVGSISAVNAVADGVAIVRVPRYGWGPYARLRLGAQLFAAPIGVAAVLAGLGVAGIFVGDAVAAVAVLLVVLQPAWRRRRPVPATTQTGGLRSLRPPVALGRPLLLFGLTQAITQIVGQRVEFLVLAVLSTDTQVAHYSVAFMVVNLAALLPTALATTTLPAVASAVAAGRRDDAARHLGLAVRVATSASLPLLGLVAVLGPPAVSLVYGEGFAGAARLVPLAAPVLVLTAAGGLCSGWWSGQGRLGVPLVVGATAGVVDVAAALALVPGSGAAGAVIANDTGQLLLAGGMLALTARDAGRIGWSGASLLRAAACAGLGAAAARAALLATGAASSGGSRLTLLVGLLVAAGAGVVALGGAAFVVRPLAAEEAAWLAEVLPARASTAVRRLSRPGPR